MTKEKEKLFEYALAYRKRCLYFKEVDRNKLQVMRHKYTAILEVIDALGYLKEYERLERNVFYLYQ